jgi:hypothetical protein
MFTFIYIFYLNTNIVLLIIRLGIPCFKNNKDSGNSAAVLKACKVLFKAQC